MTPAALLEIRLSGLADRQLRPPGTPPRQGEPGWSGGRRRRRPERRGSWFGALPVPVDAVAETGDGVVFTFTRPRRDAKGSGATA